MIRIEKSLHILCALNLAREKGDRELAARLDTELEAHDEQTRYRRSHSVDYGKRVPTQVSSELLSVERMSSKSARLTLACGHVVLSTNLRSRVGTLYQCRTCEQLSTR